MAGFFLYNCAVCGERNRAGILGKNACFVIFIKKKEGYTMANVVLTEAGFKEREAELYNLKVNARREIAEKITEAR